MQSPAPDPSLTPGFPAPDAGSGFRVGGLDQESDTDTAQQAGRGPAPAAGPGRGFARRRRKRHGRGLRGGLFLPTVPAYQTRSERFDALVMESAERLGELWGAPLEHVQFVVDEIPGQLESLVASGDRAPLARHDPAGKDGPATITVFRRPIESLVQGTEELRELVHEAIIEQAAEILNVAPEAVDPIYHRTRRL
ncbi:MAG: metallopeptidase family protein [Actinomycetales bacterium]